MCGYFCAPGTEEQSKTPGITCRYGNKAPGLQSPPQKNCALRKPVRWQGTRRGRDSNPRYPRGYAGFQDQCIRPLCHPSRSRSNIFGQSNRYKLPFPAVPKQARQGSCEYDPAALMRPAHNTPMRPARRPQTGPVQGSTHTPSRCPACPFRGEGGHASRAGSSHGPD